MKIEEFDKWVKSFLNIDELKSRDYSMNGLQVGKPGKDLKKIAFAVDASMETFRRAVEKNADMLFVHHGLYWGRPLPVTGDFYRRMEFLISENLSLYAAHLPLDMNGELGNNAAMAKALGIEEPEPFAVYGWKGVLKEPLSRDDLIKKIFGGWENGLRVLPFGPEIIRSAAVMTGSADHEVEEAIKDGVDLYLTGEAGHILYHYALEAGINVICGGHYATETYGVRLLSEKVSRELSIETVFIDVPTGL